MHGQSLPCMASTHTNSSYHNLVNNVDATAVHEILHMEPEKLSEGELTDVSYESVTRRMKMSQREWHQRTLPIEGAVGSIL